MAWWNRNRSAARGKARSFGGYDASRLGRRLKGWVAERRNINALMATGGETLRARARQLCRENPYAANAVEGFVAAAVGAGIKPSSLIADPAKKKAVMAAFLRWTDEADADGLTDFYGLQALAARAMFEAGECFIRFRPRRPEDGLSVPLQLQLLEAEHLPLSHNEDLGNGRTIRAGIEFDAIGRRVAYHFLRSHPGDLTLNFAGLEKTIVPASEVMHLYRPLRPGQVRGQPGITPGMIRLYLLDSYEDAELDRKRTAAMYVGFITKKAEGDPDPVTSSPVEGYDDTGVQAAADVGTTDLQPGTLQVLLEGEDIKFSQPVEVGGSYEAFMFRSLCSISAALGLPYHVLSGDLSKANYGSQRGGQVEFRRRMDQFQHMTLVFQMCRPVWERWLEAAVLVGAVPITPREYLREPSTFNSVKWIPPRWEWVDPLKDRQAELLAVRAGFKPISDVIEAEGYDAAEVFAEIAAMNTLADNLGIITDADPRKVSRAGLTQARTPGSALPDTDVAPSSAA